MGSGGDGMVGKCGCGCGLEGWERLNSSKAKRVIGGLEGTGLVDGRMPEPRCRG